MKVAVMGAGAVGSYYGALLARAGVDVTLVTRGDHLKAIQKNGLKVKSYFGDFEIPFIKATDSPTSVGPVDLILFTAKTYDTAEASRAILSLTGPDTAIVPLQNVNMAGQIGKIVGNDHVLGGLTYIYVAKEEPGVINQTSSFHRIVFGEFSGEVTPRADSVRKVLELSGATLL